MPSNDMQAFRELLKTSKNIVMVAGAGLSSASGIPTFRGSGGMWRKYDAMQLATPEVFARNPGLVWQFYHYRRETALKAQPNAAHLAIASFSVPKVRHTIAPDSSFTLITQNVDGLSPRANGKVFAEMGEPMPNNPPCVLEMHGRLFDVQCRNRACQHVEFDKTSPVCEGLAGTEELVEREVLDSNIPIENLPRCKACGSLARPGVVWFGEIPYHLPLIDRIVAKADLCIVVGTSSEVYPAAGYSEKVKMQGGKVAVFNYETTNGDSYADFVFLEPCEELLPKALGLVDSEASEGVPSQA